MAGVVIEHKKGEVNELKASLRNPAIDRDPDKKRDVVKRVIAYMTLGIDVSKLFSEMIMATGTKDHVVKKMVYLYICNYAATNQDLALLAINTLQKDCRDEDPMTRGLALRSFTSLRLPNVIEYLPTVIRAGLQDQSPYVRKTAVISCVKLHLFHAEALKDSDIVNTLYTMLRDRDAQVVSNCVCALNEILCDEGGMAINKQIVHHLLNRMREFNEWSQCTILDLVARYKPSERQETFDIMNLLEERLKHSNSAVVLAATKVFLNLTQDMPAVHSQVFARLKAPMLTLMTGGIFEQSFVCLKHIALLVTRAPEVFADEFKQFYCRYNDPACVKLLKLEILTQVATSTNMGEAVEEIAEYVTDPDPEVARGAVVAIGKMGIKVPSLASVIVDQLMKFLEVNIDYVCAEALLSMKNLLRKYPEKAGMIIYGLGTFLKSVEEPDAKVALLWMIAEYGHVIPESPYLIEPLIDSFADEPSQLVRLELLATATRLFFRRPAEMQAMLGRLLGAAIADASFTDVHDRAMLYYRLLRCDVKEASRVLEASSHVDGAFVEEAASELQDKIFEEFNSLSVVYGEPSELFLPPEAIARNLTPSAIANANDSHDANGGSADCDEVVAPQGPPVSAEFAPPQGAPPLAASPPAPEIDLLGLLDDLPATPPVAPPALPPAALALSAAVTLDAGLFQKSWASLPTSDSWSMQATLAADLISARFATKHIKCMAFGDVGDQVKFYFFAQEASPAATLLLVELIIGRATLLASATIKSSVSQAAVQFSSMLKEELGKAS